MSGIIMGVLRPKPGVEQAGLDVVAREIAESRFGDQPIPAMVLMAAERHPRGLPMAEGDLLMLEMAGAPEKDLFAVAVRALAVKCGARELVFLGEFWVVEGEDEVRRGQEIPDWANHPARMEKVMLRHETRRDTTTYVADIAEKDGIRSMGPWGRNDGDETGGRLARFMPGEGTA